MYKQCEERKLRIYNNYSTNQSTRIFTTKLFSQPNGCQYYCISEYTWKHFQKKKIEKSDFRVAQF